MRSFAWLTNIDLRKIVERDFRELTLVLFPSGAWKSSVVLAGSILEAILYDRLTRDGSWVAKAMSATKAPKKRGGIVKDIAANAEEDEWKLAFLIKVASELAVRPGRGGSRLPPLPQIRTCPIKASGSSYHGLAAHGCPRAAGQGSTNRRSSPFSRSHDHCPRR